MNYCLIKSQYSSVKKKKRLLGVNYKVLVKLAYKRVPWREKRTAEAKVNV